MMNKLKRRIVICGSMSFYGTMVEIQGSLKRKGVISLVPPDDKDLQLSISSVLSDSFKKAASMQHIIKIRDPRTFGVLIVNPEKHSIPDYIGANSFAEIAIAFAHHKRIYILGRIPSFYKDELDAWGAVSLEGKLDPLVLSFLRQCEFDAQQLELFPVLEDS
jgi:hypothetical protein